MVKGEGILDGIVDAFEKAKPIFIGIGGAILIYIILLIIMGVFNKQVQTGNIGVDPTTQASIQGAVGNFTAIGTSIMSALNSVTGFIVVGVIIILAGFIIGKNALSNNSSGKGRKGRKY